MGMVLSNSKDLDADGDGCYDVSEAGLSDPDGDGLLGDGFNLSDSSSYNFINHIQANSGFGGIGWSDDFEPNFTGQGVDISADGNIVVYGSKVYDGDNGTDSGYAAVYQRSTSGTSSWTLMGEFFGTAANDWFGQTVSINGPGTVIAVGSHRSEPNGGSNRGAVYIYRYNPNSSMWIQDAVVTTTDTTNDEYFGHAVSLNHEGNRLAVGVPNNDDGGSNAGEVKVYQYNSGTSSWDLIGDVNGDSNNDYFGFAVKMNKAGDRFVASAPYGDANGSNSGEASVYQYNGSSWSRLGAVIPGYSSSDYFGTGCY